MTYRLDRIREKILIAIAWALPRSVAKWAYIRVAAHATQVPEGRNDTPSDINILAALKRWDTRTS